MRTYEERDNAVILYRVVGQQRRRTQYKLKYAGSFYVRSKLMQKVLGEIWYWFGLGAKR